MGFGASFSAAEYFPLFVDLFTNSSDVVFLVHLNDRVVLDVNDAAQSLFQITRAEAVGRTVEELDIVLRPEEMVALFDEVATTGMLHRRRVRCHDRWGEEFTLEVSAILGHLRGEEVILGIARLAAPD